MNTKLEIQREKSVREKKAKRAMSTGVNDFLVFKVFAEGEKSRVRRMMKRII